MRIGHRHVLESGWCASTHVRSDTAGSDAPCAPQYDRATDPLLAPRLPRAIRGDEVSGTELSVGRPPRAGSSARRLPGGGHARLRSKTYQATLRDSATRLGERRSTAKSADRK